MVLQFCLFELFVVDGVTLAARMVEFVVLRVRVFKESPDPLDVVTT